MSVTPYRDGSSMWRAIGARARAAAETTTRPANELLRRFVYDRFLARVFVDPDAAWVLKGGTAVLARVHDARHSKDVDLVTGSLMTADPEQVQPSTPLQVPGLLPPTVRAYPVVDHIADKVAATEARYADDTRSTRVRDLIDLVVLPHIDIFAVPSAWADQYPRMAATTPHCQDFKLLADAANFVALFLEPAMTGTVDDSTWCPTARTWRHY